MAKRESTVERDRQKLQDIFESVTGETVITDRQDQDTDKKVVNLRKSDTEPSAQRVDADSVGDGLEDVIDDPEPE